MTDRTCCEPSDIEETWSSVLNLMRISLKIMLVVKLITFAVIFVNGIKRMIYSYQDLELICYALLLILSADSSVMPPVGE